MDNITHTLFALTLARTPLGRAGRGTTAALVLASNAPDIDVVTSVGGMQHYLTWHRGPTHGPIGVIGLGLVVAGLVGLSLRMVRPREGDHEDASFPLLVPIAMIGVLLHILMDLPTSYGTRLLSPFDWHWFALDWMPIIDVYLLVVLAAGLLFGSRSTVARRRNAAIALVLMATNYGVRAAAHRQALANAPRLFGPALPRACSPLASAGHMIYRWPLGAGPDSGEPAGRCLVELVAVPTFLSPFSWRVVAHLSNAFEIQDVDLLDARFRRPSDETAGMWRTTYRVPNIWTPPVWTAASTKLGQTFLGFARLPAARSFVDSTGTATVRWSDMRFIGARMALAPPRNDPFGIVIRIAPDGHILDEQLGP